MNHLIKYGFSLLLCIVISISAIAQTYNFTKYGLEDGLQQIELGDIRIGPKGELWISSSSGAICLYDGHEFRPFELNDELSLPSVACLMYDTDSSMWIGSIHSLYQYKNGRLKQLESVHIKNLIRVVYRYKDELLIGHDKGLSIYNIKTDQTVDIIAYNNLQITSIVKWKNTVLIAALNKGIVAYKDGVFSSFSENIDMKDATVTMLYPDPIDTDKLYIGHLESIEVWDGKALTTFRDGISSSLDYPTRMFRNENNIWIGDHSVGLLKFDGYKFQLIKEEHGISHDQFCGIYGTPSGDVFFSTPRGLFALASERFIHYDQAAGLNDKTVFSLLSDGDGNIWTGSENGVLNKITRHVNEADDIVHFQPRYRFSQPIVLDSSGYVWSKDGASSVRFNPKTQKFENKTPAVFRSLKNVVVHMALPKNKMLITAGKDYLIYDLSSNTYVNITAILPHNERGIFASTVDASGKIWLSFLGTGITIVDPEKVGQTRYQPIRINEETGLSFNSIYDIELDGNNNVWIGTGGKGIQVFDPVNYREIHKYKKGEISSNTIYSFVKKQNQMWVGCEKGIDKLVLDKHSRILSSKTFGLAEGFTGIECSQNSAVIDQDGNVFFGTLKGVTMYQEQKDYTDTIPPRLILNDLKLQYESIDWTNESLMQGRVHFKKINPATGLPVDPHFHHLNNHISFDFTGIQFHDADKVIYQWKLDGFEKHWSAKSRKHEVTYSNIPHGKYIFKVRASMDGEHWSEEITYKLKIDPPFWNSWWFYALLLFGLGVATYSLFMVRNYQHTQEKKILEQLVKERTLELEYQSTKVEAQSKQFEQMNIALRKFKKNITSSINYAQRIQQSILPDEYELQILFEDSFMLNIPRDVVSGDFPWIVSYDHITYVAVGDCTGHGVPGAMLSVLGYFALKEIIEAGHDKDTGDILLELHHSIQDTLKQHGNNLVSDGMDISLCRINAEKNTIEFAGARMPLLFNTGNYVELIRGSKFSVGGAEYERLGKTVKYDTQTIAYNKNDMIFLFSDGMQDQLGGDIFNQTRFSVSQIIDIVEHHYNLSMPHLKREFFNQYREWRGSQGQLDDILMIGIRL